MPLGTLIDSRFLNIVARHLHKKNSAKIWAARGTVFSLLSLGAPFFEYSVFIIVFYVFKRHPVPNRSVKIVGVL